MANAPELHELLSYITDYFFAHPDEVPQFLSAMEELKEFPPFLLPPLGEISAEDVEAAKRKFEQGLRLTYEEGAALISEHVEGKSDG